MRQEGDNGGANSSGAAARWAQTLLGALAAAALANVIVILATGGYDIRVAGVQVKAHTLDRPLIILLALLAARWAASLSDIGLGKSLRSFGWWGLLGGGVGIALFLAGALGQPTAIPLFQIAVVGTAALAGFALVWLAYGRHGAPARLVVFVVYLVSAWALAQALPDTSRWGRAFNLPRKSFWQGQTAAVDWEGLLPAGGSDFTLAKADVGRDWRDSVLVSPGGSFATKARGGQDAVVSFSVAIKPGCSSEASVSVIHGKTTTPIWREKAANLFAEKWLDVSAPLGSAGDVELVFDVAGSGAPVIFGNPRVDSTPSSRPNVIFFLVDAMRADRLGAYGRAPSVSPEIDEWAGGAAVFDNCVAQGPWTMPSVASFFTSLAPSVHGVRFYNSILDGKLATLPAQLRKAGYYTAAVQANPLLSPEMGIARGFNEYVHLGADITNRTNKTSGSAATAMTSAAIDVTARAGRRPFFLYLHYLDLHRPFAAVPGIDRYGDSDSAQYDAAISYVSAEFGRLVKTLAEKKLLDNTIIVLTADHGEQFMEHGMDGHASDMHAEELRIPLIVSVPGKAGRRVASLVRAIDVTPTIIELVGAKSWDYAQGASLAPAFDGGDLPGRVAWSELSTQRPYGQFIVSLTSDRYRFIDYNPDDHFSNRLELFDLASDKAEYVNIAATSPSLVADFKGRVENYLVEQRALHAKLVPVEASAAMTKEKAEQLKALGYVGPGK